MREPPLPLIMLVMARPLGERPLTVMVRALAPKSTGLEMVGVKLRLSLVEVSVPVSVRVPPERVGLAVPPVLLKMSELKAVEPVSVRVAAPLRVTLAVLLSWRLVERARVALLTTTSPPAATIVLPLALAVFSVNVPWLAKRVPVKVFAPVSVSVLAPPLTKETPAPLSTLEMVTAALV